MIYMMYDMMYDVRYVIYDMWCGVICDVIYLPINEKQMRECVSSK